MVDVREGVQDVGIWLKLLARQHNGQTRYWERL
jgi:hypothetical protein